MHVLASSVSKLHLNQLHPEVETFPTYNSTSYPCTAANTKTHRMVLSSLSWTNKCFTADMDWNMLLCTQAGLHTSFSLQPGSRWLYLHWSRWFSWGVFCFSRNSLYPYLTAHLGTSCGTHIFCLTALRPAPSHSKVYGFDNHCQQKENT